MAIGSFLALLDDITLQTKVAISSASGVVADDLALNANMVTGIPRERELPVVWAIARGSLLNKVALTASALLISAFAPGWVIPALLIVGGTYLGFEGVEKVIHALGRDRHGPGDEVEFTDAAQSYPEREKAIIRGAIVTDVVLSAEITALTLGNLDIESALASQMGILAATGLCMTVGVYGLVAMIVKMDDAAVVLMQSGRREGSLARRFGAAMLKAVPIIMKGLSIVGTAAMFVVGGGIIVHNVAPAHHLVEHVAEIIAALPGLGFAGVHLVPLVAHTLAGAVAGLAVLAAVAGIGRLRRR